MVRNKHTRIGIALAGVMLALTLTAAVASAALVTSESVTLQDPSNESVEVDVDYGGAASNLDVTVHLNDSNGNSLVSSTISGNASETKTATLDPSALAAGTYDINLTTATPSDVSLNTTRLIAERDITVEDNATDRLMIDVGFASSNNATADLTVTDENGSTVLTDTIEFYADNYPDNQTIVSKSYNDSDGLTASGNLTATLTVNGATAYTEAYASVVQGSTGSLFGGTIGGQDPAIAIGGVLFVFAGYRWARSTGRL